MYKVVSPYDLSMLSMSMMGFQKNWIELGELYIGFLDFLNFFILQSP